jgi:hypothetical protein
MPSNRSNNEDQVVMTCGSSIVEIDSASLPVVPAGQALVEHEVYIDTILRGQGPFRALPGQVAASGNGYVAELDVDPMVWDHLVRADGNAQLHGSDQSNLAQSGGQLTELGAAV